MAFKRRPIAGKFKPDSYFSRKLMGDRFPELVDLIKEHRERLQAIPHEELEMETADGLKLKGWYFDAESKNTAVIVHGFNSKAWTDCVVQACRFFEHGYNVLISDNRACGESEGKYLTYGVRESEDIARWVSLVSKRVPNGNIVLIGTSLGGATVCMCSALDLPDVKVIVEDCAYVSMRWEFEYLTKFFVHFVPRRGINAAERLAIKKFGFDFSSRSPIESIQKAKCPVFFVHGKADTFIPYSAAEELYAKCPTDKQLLLVETCGHGGAQLAGDDYFEPILAFVDKYCK
ncbi:MAG: alpha/beta hydrolase [Clostridia bacterium]|nr:alpha/beta hydrolase [Clostridia bacterium]